MNHDVNFAITNKIVNRFPLWHPCRFGTKINSDNYNSIDELISDKFDSSNLSFGQLNLLSFDDVLLHKGNELLGHNHHKPKLNCLLCDAFYEDFLLFDSGQENKLEMNLLPGILSLNRQEDSTLVFAVNNLYHFLEDSLPQIEINNSFLPPKALFISGNLDPILEEIALRASLNPITFIRDEQIISFRKLSFFRLSQYRAQLSSGEIVQIGMHSDLIKQGIDRLHDVDQGYAKPSQKIFVIRKKGLHRRLSNLRPLRTALEKSGFLCVEFEALSLEERLSLLRDCALLVGESGAGLAHAYFLNPTATVIEIRHPLMKGSLEHTTLVRTSGLKYMIVNGLYNSRILRFIYGNDSFRVNIDELMSEIGRTGEN